MHKGVDIWRRRAEGSEAGGGGKDDTLLHAGVRVRALLASSAPRSHAQQQYRHRPVVQFTNAHGHVGAAAGASAWLVGAGMVEVGNVCERREHARAAMCVRDWIGRTREECALRPVVEETRPCQKESSVVRPALFGKSTEKQLVLGRRLHRRRLVFFFWEGGCIDADLHSSFGREAASTPMQRPPKRRSKRAGTRTRSIDTGARHTHARTAATLEALAALYTT